MRLDLSKIRQVYDNYTVNSHAGLTMVMGHPFGDDEFKNHIGQVQNAIKSVFQDHGLDDALVLYDVNYQVHATLIELASQHVKERNDQCLLEEPELHISSATKQFMNVNYAATWIKKTSPFEIELGSDVLTEAHSDQTLRITDTGQIVMKGRAKDRHLLADVRAEFESNAGIVHKYGKDDDEFFFVIGYLKPDERILNPEFCTQLERCIENRRNIVKLALKVDSVKFIMYKDYSLSRNACIWETPDLPLQQEVKLSQNNLVDSVIEVIRKEKLRIDLEGHQEAM